MLKVWRGFAGFGVWINLKISVERYCERLMPECEAFFAKIRLAVEAPMLSPNFGKKCFTFGVLVALATSSTEVFGINE